MKRLLSALLSICLLLSLTAALAEPETGAEPDPEPAIAAPAAEEPLSVTQHTAQIGGQTLNYTATAGRLEVSLQDQVCEMFFTAYTLDGVEDVDARPVTFAFNGGPGSSSEWLHLGMLGPRRVEVDADGQPQSLPVKLVDNPNSILDMTDLVFIDPVGTGYSRVAEGCDPNAFYTYIGDIASVGEFIRLYVSRNGRWGSPKYVAGESYGTIRAVGVANYLSDNYAMGLNGVMLVSAINDMSTSSEITGSDLSYALCLPSYAAVGWYHGLLDEKYQAMAVEDYLNEVREYAGSDFQAALFKGAQLTDVELEATAERVAAYTGLKKDFVLRSNLRVSIDNFCAELLSDRKLMVGRIDARYTGPITAGDVGNSTADPSMAALGDAFGTAINQYLAGELDYHSDLVYETLSYEVNMAWYYNLDNQTLDQKQDVYALMSRNRFLKLWVLCGYYDLATPYFAAEWVYNHVFLNEDTRENLAFTHYPSGHMMYMHEPSLTRFHQEAGAWYAGGRPEAE